MVVRLHWRVHPRRRRVAVNLRMDLAGGLRQPREVMPPPLTPEDVAALPPDQQERLLEVTVLRLNHDSGALGAAFAARLMDEGRIEAAIYVLEIVDPEQAKRLRADPRRAKA
jgi:hypothetical protein